MRPSRLLIALLALALVSAGAGAQDDSSHAEASAAVAHKATGNPGEVPPVLAPIVAKLHPQHGKIDLDGVAELNLPDDLGYLPPREAETLMHKVVGIPGKVPQLGAIVPTSVGIGSPASWYTLITVQPDGRVNDDAGKTLDPAAVMQRMQTENKARNKALKKRGFYMIGYDLMGWAEPPRYDAAGHTLLWAFEAMGHERKEHVVNYNIRFLGARGMLSLSIVGRFDQLPMITGDGSRLASALTFKEPFRYTDARPADKQASYNLIDVIAGDDHALATAAEHGKPPATDSQKYLLSAILVVCLVLLFKLRKRKRAA